MRRRLRLQQVWLMVSPGNPLKPVAGMMSPERRLESARTISDGRRIVATDIERRLGTRYSVDTIRLLRTRFPNARFVWLMGADILDQLPRWKHWPWLVGAAPFAVMPRPSYNHRALASRAAQALRGSRRPDRAASALAGLSPPAWTFLPAAQNAASATAIRAIRPGD